MNILKYATNFAGAALGLDNFVEFNAAPKANNYYCRMHYAALNLQLFAEF